MTNFLYFLINEGNAQLLKDEIKRRYPFLTPAYSRPGFISFKNTNPSGEILRKDLDVVFCYSYGLSLGKAKKSELIAKIKEQLDSKAFMSRPVLNSFHCEEEYKEILAAFPDRFKTSGFEPSDQVLEIVKVVEDEFFIGCHAFGTNRTYLNDYFSAADVPSRAYFKMREAVSLTGAKLESGQTVLDLGAAPGGSSLYFLQKGLKVTGLDPADIDAACVKNKNFRHLKFPIEKLDLRFLNIDHFDWIALDINLDPLYLTHILTRIIKDLKTPPQGLFFMAGLTQKFSQARIPEFLEILKKCGFQSVVARQVPSNKSEFLAFASNLS